MKFEEKIKEKYLYSKGFNVFKIFYFYYQFLKSKKALKKKVFIQIGVSTCWQINYLKKKKDGFFIDVGCHQPFLNNNTFRLYKRGWTRNKYRFRLQYN